MKNIKKFAALLAATSLVFALVSCANNADDDENNSKNQDTVIPSEPDSPESPVTPENPITPDAPTEGGITVTVAPASEIKITKAETSNSITLTAEEGFDTNSYSWRIDEKLATTVTGASVNGNGTVLTITKSSLIENEAYQISLSATKNNIPYSTQITIKVKKD